MFFNFVVSYFIAACNIQIQKDDFLLFIFIHFIITYLMIR